MHPWDGGIHIGPHWGSINASAINVGQVDIDVRWEPAPAYPDTEPLSKSDNIISILELRIDEMLQMIQDFEKIANPEAEFELLKELGFDRRDDTWSLKTEDTTIDIFGPYNRSWTVSRFRWYLSISRGGRFVYDRYFDTLNELLDHLVNGEYSDD